MKFKVTRLDGSSRLLEADSLLYAQNNKYLDPFDIVIEINTSPIALWLANKSNAFWLCIVGNVSIAIATLNYPIWDECIGCILWSVMIGSWSAWLRSRQ